MKKALTKQKLIDKYPNLKKYLSDICKDVSGISGDLEAGAVSGDLEAGAVSGDLEADTAFNRHT